MMTRHFTVQNYPSLFFSGLFRIVGPPQLSPDWVRILRAAEGKSPGHAASGVYSRSDQKRRCMFSRHRAFDVEAISG